MAINFTEQTFGPRTVSAVDAGSDQIILEDSLDSFDKYHLELAMAESTLGDYTMPNGQTADVYFDEYIRTAAELTADYNRYATESNIEGTISTIQATLDDHETRITALEP